MRCRASPPFRSGHERQPALVEPGLQTQLTVIAFVAHVITPVPCPPLSLPSRGGVTDGRPGPKCHGSSVLALAAGLGADHVSQLRVRRESAAGRIELARRAPLDRHDQQVLARANALWLPPAGNRSAALWLAAAAVPDRDLLRGAERARRRDPGGALSIRIGEQRDREGLSRDGLPARPASARAAAWPRCARSDAVSRAADNVAQRDVTGQVNVIL